MAENEIKVQEMKSSTKNENALEKALIEDYFRLRRNLAELDEKNKELDEKMRLLRSKS